MARTTTPHAPKVDAWSVLAPFDVIGPPELQQADAAAAALEVEHLGLTAALDDAYEANDTAALVALSGRSTVLPLLLRQARQHALTLRTEHLTAERERMGAASTVLTDRHRALIAQLAALNAELADLLGPIAEAAGRYDVVSRHLAEVHRWRELLATAPQRRPRAG